MTGDQIKDNQNRLLKDIMDYLKLKKKFANLLKFSIVV